MKRVKQALGIHFEIGGEESVGWFPPDAVSPGRSDKRAIVLDLHLLEADDGVVLEWSSDDESYSGDLWFLTMSDAFEEAHCLWGVPRDQWCDP